MISTETLDKLIKEYVSKNPTLGSKGKLGFVDGFRAAEEYYKNNATIPSEEEIYITTNNSCFIGTNNQTIERFKNVSKEHMDNLIIYKLTDKKQYSLQVEKTFKLIKK